MSQIDVQVGKVVKRSADYAVIVWEGTDKEKTGEYGVYNTTHGVLETSTPLLAQALMYLSQLQTAIDKENAPSETEKKLASVSEINPSDVH